MSNDGRAIANYVLDYCDSNGISVSNLSLQKLVFFCHAWHLATTQKPLIKHQFEAWEYGPVLQYLYRDFRSGGSEPITSRATKRNLSSGELELAKYELDGETDALLQKVLGFYGRLSPGTLVQYSHVEDGPWEVVWREGGLVNPGMGISDEAIKKFYEAQLIPF